MQTLSDTHNHSFGEQYGTLIEGLPMPLLSRAACGYGVCQRPMQ
jgi:thiol peroxidase